MSPVLEVRDVWKSYPDWTGQPRTLRGAVSRRSPLFRSGRSQRWALRGVTLTLGPGQGVGVIGHNGSGKSTLLRLVSGLGRPSRGTIQVHPDTTAVLSFGSSFDLQLTGRENALTAALISGMSRREARTALTTMLEFSELAEFVDAPVRTYSEGMKLRLAFGLIAALHPRLLVLDEVLAVGDAAFRARCLERIAQLRDGGTSLVLASHSMSELRDACDQALWLHRGSVRAFGDIADVVEAYETEMHRSMLAATPVGAGSQGARGAGLALGENRFGSQELTIERVTLAGVTAGEDGVPPSVPAGDPLRIQLRLGAGARPIEDVTISIAIRALDDTPLIDLAADRDALPRGALDAGTMIELTLDRLDLRAGEYKVDVGVYERDWEHVLDFHWSAYRFRVTGPAGNGALAPPHSWRVEPSADHVHG
jgi:lipopolysaccharide transport system ATP-binding protein